MMLSLVHKLSTERKERAVRKSKRASREHVEMGEDDGQQVRERDREAGGEWLRMTD